MGGGGVEGTSGAHASLKLRSVTAVVTVVLTLFNDSVREEGAWRLEIHPGRR